MMRTVTTSGTASCKINKLQNKAEQVLNVCL